MMPGRDQRILFLGGGGMGMAPLACWMAADGYSITGYDAFLQERVRRHLAASGVVLRDFLFAEHLRDYDLVVHSSAVGPEHPILAAALEAGVPCRRRGQILAALGSQKKLVAVAGSHGKTTTTALIAHAVQKYDLPVDFILGGLFADAHLAPSRHCGSKWLVAEVDESDGTIEDFHPEHTVLLNMDWDHADRYAASAQLEAAFAQLAARTRGRVWHPAGLELPELGAGGQAELRQTEAGAPQAGLNAGNRTAAQAVLQCLHPGLPEDALDDFSGVARRQTLLLERPGLTVLEDYAHHPTELTALIAELRRRAGQRRLEVVFQPHRYSRTRQFREAFARSLSEADRVSLLPVYAAHEPVCAGGELADLLAAFPQPGPEVLPVGLAGIDQVCASAAAGEVLLAFVGAGDIEDFAAACAGRLRHPDSVDAAFLDYARPRLSPEAKLSAGEPLARKTTMRIGGPARLYAEPANRADLQVLLRAARLFGLPHFCLGRGSNLLVADAGIDALVIRFALGTWKQIERLDGDRLWVGAGCRLKEICGFAARCGLEGFEFLEGIPGALGGALRMNAGAMGSWMFDVVERVQLIDEGGQFQDWPRDAFHFAYREVKEVGRGIALGAILKSPQAGQEQAIRGRIDSYANARKESQPRGASAGCIFKNPEGDYAGKLIDQHGLKGMRVGGAEVSAVHGNFIVNTGSATAADVIELVRQVRRRIREAAGVDLEPEVLLVGGSWEAVLQEASDD